MRVQQTVLGNTSQLTALPTDQQADLLLVFGDIAFFKHPGLADTLRERYPNAALIGCSTAGEISAKGVDDGRCVLTAVDLEKTTLQTASTPLPRMEDSQSVGEQLARQLPVDKLRAVLVYGPGLNINGSALVRGLSHVLGDDIPITGGLAGDGGAFAQTFTLGPNGVSDQTVVAVGLYGDQLDFAHGSFGGWEPFGPARKVTRCEGNVLFELDGEPALEVYRRYLGDYAKDLPASGLLFPFAMLGKNRDENGLIRTILGIDSDAGSLTLAGEIDPEGYLRLMHASTDRLVSGAEAAAELLLKNQGAPSASALGILVSCVGRKLVMGERVEEEVEVVAERLGKQATLTGFYSYGEISPFVPEGACRLHNQTMTITRIQER